MNFKRLTLALALAGLPSLSFATQVLTTLPVTHSLASALLDGTAVQLKRAAPANLPASRQPSYFSGRGGASLEKAAQQADAVIGVRSIWRDDPLYPMARRSNIRIVEIDAARPVDGALPGIAVSGDDAYGATPGSTRPTWGVWPMWWPTTWSASPQVTKRRSRQPGGPQTPAAGAFGQQPDTPGQGRQPDRGEPVRAAGLPRQRLNLDVVEQPLPAEWDAATLKALEENLKAQDVALVLDHRQPDAAVAEVIKAAGAKLVVVESDPDDAFAGLKASVDQVVGALGES